MLDQIITPQNLDKLSSYYTDQILKILFQQVPGLKQLFDEKKSLYDEAFKIIKSFLSMQVSKKSAHQSANFTKVSAGPRGLPGGGGGGGGRGGGLFGGMATGDKAKAFEKFLGGNWQELVDIVFDFIPGGGIGKFIVKGLIKFAIPRLQKVAEQAFLNLDFKRREYILQTMQSFQEKMKPHEFSPSAYKKVLDEKGYKGQELSQGAYDVKTPAFYKEIEDQKAKNPEKFKAPFSYLEDKDVQDRKKGKKFQFYNPSKKKEEQSSEQSSEETTQAANNNQRFVKLSQVENKKVDQELTRRVETIKELLSPWNEEMIKQSFLKIANRTDISEEQKSAIIEKQVAEYMRSIKPLQTYMNSLRKI